MYRLDVTEPTEDLIVELINDYDNSDIKKLMDYYHGKQEILIRDFEDETKPNNKIVTNFCKYISDVSVGNFIGVPVSYSSTNEDYLEIMQDIFNYNDEQQINMKLAYAASIARIGYEILYTVTDKDGKLQIRFDELDLNEQTVILVYDRSIEKNLIMAIRYFDFEDIDAQESQREVYVYTESMIYHYLMDGDELSLQDETVHFFQDVPINPYFNKSEDPRGDFEDIMTLNDAYNLLVSDDINESDYSNDAYLIIKGMDAEDEDIQKMKEHRVIKVTDSGEASWLVKTINDTWKENIKNRIVTDIHKISATPDMTDNNFAGTATGIALKYKLLPFENNRAAKERMFKKALQRRVELITNLLNVQGHQFDWRDITMTFTPNLPVNEVEEIDVVTKLIGTGLASNDTLRNKLSFIEDSKLEQEKLDEERAEYVDLTRMADEEVTEDVAES